MTHQRHQLEVINPASLHLVIRVLSSDRFTTTDTDRGVFKDQIRHFCVAFSRCVLPFWKFAGIGYRPGDCGKHAQVAHIRESLLDVARYSGLRFRRMGWIVIVVAALIGFAAPASADSNDDAFTNALHTHNIPVRDDAASIHLAHIICQELAQGASMNAITDIGQVYGHNLSHDQAQFVVQSAAAVYCPQYIN